MTLSRRLIGRAIAIAVAGFLVIGLAVPFLSADRFRNRIQRALESAIGRKVEIGKIRLDLFQGPGFSLEKVVIYDDPAFGIEPFAWVETLEARPRWLSLWKRKLEFASLRLGDPSVNLVKTTRWNFERYLDPQLIAALPRIAVRGGRINFKFGDTKSVYYVTNADLDIAAPAGIGADWRFEFSGEPARTDQPARGLGYFSGKGRWHGDAVRLDLELERSALGELTTLVSGRDLGVHGMVSARAIIAGPLSALNVNGRLQIEEPHRWDQTPASGERWPMNFSGTLDLPGQRFSVDSAVTGGAIRPLSVRYRVNDYLTEPRWSVAVTWNRFPAEPVLPILARLGVRLPEGIKLNGAIDGAVGYSSHGSLQGSVALREGKLIFPGAPELKLGDASAMLDGDRLHVNPLELDSAGSRVTAEADYWWSKDSLALNLTADDAAVSALPLQAAGLRANFLEPLRSGRWSGRLSHINGEWSGQAQLSDASVDVPGIVEPVALRTLRLRIQGDRLAADSIQGTAGQVAFRGDYRYEPGAARPHRFRFAVEQVDAVQLERLFQPALRPRQGFFQRTLGIGRRSLPEWLAALRADGRLTISALGVGALALENVEVRVQWDAAQVRFTELRAKLDGGAIAGDLSLSLRAAGPMYRANLKASGLDFRNGSLDGDAAFETSGAGAELLARLRAEGSFSGRGWDLGSLRDVKNVTGAYRFEKGRLELRDLEVTAGSDLYLGSGVSESDGRLELSLAAGQKQMKVSGTLAQWRVE